MSILQYFAIAQLVIQSAEHQHEYAMTITVIILLCMDVRLGCQLHNRHHQPSSFNEEKFSKEILIL